MKPVVLKTLLVSLLTTVLLSACGTSQQNRYQLRQDRAPHGEIDVSRIPDAQPRVEPRSQYGNPASYKVRGKTYYVKQSSKGYHAKGVASWYGQKFHGHRTSSGETYDMYSMTAAHKSLPLPTYVRVTHLQNSRSVIVKVNDRGPFHDDRLIDLSYAAASKLGVTSKGTGIVEVVAIDPQTYLANKSKTTTTKIQPASPVPTSLEYSLYLQAGAFVSRVNAEQLRAKLQALYNSRKITSAYFPDKQVYRVRIGPLASVEEADKLAHDINQHGLDRPHIVID
ncbi:MAG: septal ring lytic transglycosylase RlpA family protein [Gammaproteobacteria bacterium]|nr:septal ring lytic transglycosylase RlpA family protein [Gammaproteobacteria bacterium]